MKKKFAAASLDLEYKTFIVHIATLSVDSSDEMHPSKKVQIAHLKADKASTKVLSKYVNFANVFLSKFAVELSEHSRINNYAIELVDDWQSPYGSIYSLASVELETLKAYIENNLANGFIRLFKSLTEVSILFDKKPDKSLRFCIDYQDPNNLTIKN